MIYKPLYIMNSSKMSNENNNTVKKEKKVTEETTLYDTTQNTDEVSPKQE